MAQILDHTGNSSCQTGAIQGLKCKLQLLKRPPEQPRGNTTPQGKVVNTQRQQLYLTKAKRLHCLVDNTGKIQTKGEQPDRKWEINTASGQMLPTSEIPVKTLLLRAYLHESIGQGLVPMSSQASKHGPAASSRSSVLLNNQVGEL